MLTDLANGVINKQKPDKSSSKHRMGAPPFHKPN